MSKIFLGPLGKEQEWPNITAVNPLSISYGDVLIAPKPNTEILSRSHIDTTVQFGPFKLTVPFIAAPMDTIVGEKMARELARLGALAALPRGDTKSNLELCERLSNDNVPCLYSIGLKDSFNIAKEFKERGAKIILIDIAHGGLKELLNQAVKIREELEIEVVIGNIGTYSQALAYRKVGLTTAKVGVGPGSVCITRLVAGVGIPQLSAIFDTSSVKGLTIIADGGIKYPGDMAKAIAAGANLVMGGSILAGTDETPGELTEGKKKYRGQASREYMNDNNIKHEGHRTAEGISTFVESKGPVESIIHEFLGGLKSAMSYSGARDIKEFQNKAKFVSISNYSQKENSAHIHLL